MQLPRDPLLLYSSTVISWFLPCLIVIVCEIIGDCAVEVFSKLKSVVKRVANPSPRGKQRT
jgi:hypothetical protein